MTRCEERDSELRTQNIIRAFFFVLFFSIGATVLGGSIVWDDLLGYYNNRRLVEAQGQSLNRVELLDAEYDALLQLVQEDPSVVKRIAPATLGAEPGGEGVSYPRARARELAVATEALKEKSEGESAVRRDAARWIARCSEPSNRLILFLAGAGLILVSFVCFGPVQEHIS